MAHPGLTPLAPTIFHSSTPLTHSSAHAILSSFLRVAELDASLRPDSLLSERGPASASSAANPNLTLAHLGRIARGMHGERVGGGAGVDYDEEEEEEEEVGMWGPDGRNKKKKRKFGEEGGGDETPRIGKRKEAALRDDAGQDVVLVEERDGAGEVAVVSTSAGRAQGEDEWQDRENYDLAQENGEVDVGNAQRSNGVGVRDVEEDVGTEGSGAEGVDPRTADAKEKGQRVERERETSPTVNHDVVHENESSKLDKAERKRLKKEKSKREKKTARLG